jgi:hypothetical protein
MQLARRRGRSCESPLASLACVSAFNTGFLWDHINGGLSVPWLVLGRVACGKGRMPGYSILGVCGVMWASTASTNTKMY